MHLDFWTMTLIGCGLVVALIVLKKLQPEPVIRVALSTGEPRSNEAGDAIRRNECPVCHQTDADFYYGEAPPTPRYHIIYCANSECRATLHVENYGEGRVYVDVQGEPAPSRLYGLSKAP